MNATRRMFLKRAGTLTGFAAAIAAGWLDAGSALAASVWNRMAFTAKTLPDAFANAGYANAQPSSDIVLETQDIAENGAVVPVTATSKIPGTTSMAIFIDKNPNPLIAEFVFSNGAEPFIATRVKMAETSSVRIAVKAGGKVYITSREVKVTSGGCGG